MELIEEEDPDSVEEEMPDTIDLSDMEQLPDIDIIREDNRQGDVVEDYDNPDGTHVHKVTHDEDGVRSVRVTQSGPGSAIGGGPSGIMKAIMDDMMSGMAAGPPPGIRISGGPGRGAPPGMIRIGGPPPPMDDDDDDDDDKHGGIPPEILDLIRMTEMLHGGGGFGPQFRLNKPDEPKKEKPVTQAERKDESMDDIMARMNKISEEIGEQQEKKRNYDTSTSKNQRFTQVLMVGGIVIVVMVISFVLTCANNKKKGKDEDDKVVENDVAGAFRQGFRKND